MAAFTHFPNLKDTPDDRVDHVLAAYDNVSKEQIMKHYEEFDSQEEMEHYAHNLAVLNQEIHEWE
jgi:hypothetical protein